MSPDLTDQEKEEIRALLRRAFKEEEADVLLGVLERVIARRDEVVTRQDLQRLQATIAEGHRALQGALARLAEAQARTDERVGELVAAQARTDQLLGDLAVRVDRVEGALARLAEAQARTDERVGDLAVRVDRVEGALARLAEAQARTEERVDRLAAAQERTESRLDRVELALARLSEAQAHLETAVADLAKAQARTEKAVERLARQVGGLSETVGGDIEDIAYIVIHDVLGREFGWKVGVLERAWQRWDGRVEEINIFGQANDPAHPGRTIWIVGEAKHNLTLKQVERFARLVERARQHLAGEVFPVCFCYRARPEVQERLQELGIRLVFSYGRMK